MASKFREKMVANSNENSTKNEKQREIKKTNN